MLKTKSILIVTALVVSVALGVATGVWAEPCPQNINEPNPNFDCNGHKVEGPLQGVPVVCPPDQDPGEVCLQYTWTITSIDHAASHLDVIVTKDIADNIVTGPDLVDPICNGSGDPSLENAGVDFGVWLQWHCTVKIDAGSKNSKMEGGIPLSLVIKGDSDIVFTDAVVKAATGEQNFGWGITTGPGSGLELPKYSVYPRVTVDDIGTAEFPVRVRLTRKPSGCSFRIDYCIDPDPIYSYKCNVDEITGEEKWIPATEVSDDENSDLESIINCSEIRSAGGVDICDECTISQQVNPGWVYYRIAGTWYKICAGQSTDASGAPLPCGCLDPETNICCTYSSTCYDCSNPDNAGVCP
jgi:hypothetical protein